MYLNLNIYSIGYQGYVPAYFDLFPLKLKKERLYQIKKDTCCLEVPAVGDFLQVAMTARF